MSKKDKKILIGIFCLVFLVVITVGVSYALFTYSGKGTTENIIKTGNIKFLYTENENVGNGISIQDALPTDDNIGKVQAGSGKVFDFKVTGMTAGTANISYEVTAMKMDSSTLPEDTVKLYLTESVGSVETESPLTTNAGKVKTYAELRQTSRSEKNEKTIYLGTIPTNTANYEKNFTLRMWISSDADFSPDVDENGNSTSGDGKYNNQTFSIKVNVYANDARINGDAPLSYVSYQTGDQVTLKDGSKWYVLANSGENNDTVTLLKEEGITQIAYDIDGTTTYDEGDSNNVGSYIKDTYLPTLKTSLTSSAGDPTGLNIRLLTKSDVDNLKTLAMTISEINSWLYNGTYWTTTVSPVSAKLYTLSGTELVETEATNATVYVRPVVTLLKTNIA